MKRATEDERGSHVAPFPPLETLDRVCVSFAVVYTPKATIVVSMALGKDSSVG